MAGRLPKRSKIPAAPAADPYSAARRMLGIATPAPDTSAADSAAANLSLTRQALGFEPRPTTARAKTENVATRDQRLSPTFGIGGLAGPGEDEMGRPGRYAKRRAASRSIFG